ncbi:corticosteroid 11-beta-dehydrogenase isozyme 2 [Polypterus senegalus]
MYSQAFNSPTWIYLTMGLLITGGSLMRQRAWSTSLAFWVPLLVLLGRLCSFWLPTPVGVAIFSAVFWFVVRTGSQDKLLPTEGKAVFITGCDTGFGKTAAIQMDSLGFQVFATVLNMEGPGALELRKRCSPKLTLIQMDMRKHEDIESALQITKKKLGRKGLWGLVNNAGICTTIGDAELSLMSSYRGCMEVNFFGTINVTKMFLPLVRQEKGRIVTISSPSAEQPFPSLAAYGCSKAALNLFMKTLRQELKLWGVSVSTILPSAYKTAPSRDPFYWNDQCEHLIRNLPPSLLEEYGEEYVQETKHLFQEFAKHTSEDFSPVINRIVEALLSSKPNSRYYAGRGIRLMYFINDYLPSEVSDRYLQKIFLKKKILPRALNNSKPPS